MHKGPFFLHVGAHLRDPDESRASEWVLELCKNICRKGKLWLCLLDLEELQWDCCEPAVDEYSDEDDHKSSGKEELTDFRFRVPHGKSKGNSTSQTWEKTAHHNESTHMKLFPCYMYSLIWKLNYTPIQPSHFQTLWMALSFTRSCITNIDTQFQENSILKSKQRCEYQLNDIWFLQANGAYRHRFGRRQDLIWKWSLPRPDTMLSSVVSFQWT